MKLFHKFLISTLSLPTIAMPIITTSCNNNSTSDPRPHMLKWEKKDSTWDPERCNIVITFEQEVKGCKFTSFHTAKVEFAKTVMTIKDTLINAELRFTVTGTNNKTRDYYLTWNWGKATLAEGN